MKFGDFAGNAALKSALSAAVDSGRVSHSYLICGPLGSGRHTLARILAAAMVCTGSGEAPCGVCPACRKAFSGQHPDIIPVRDPAHKQISVEQIRRLRADAYIRPNEAKRKVYLIEQDIRVEGQQALLKILEEPPEYAAFLILSDRLEKLLPTIRSRCQHLHLSPVPEREALALLKKKKPDADEQAILAALRRCGGFAGQALQWLEAEEHSEKIGEFARCFAQKDTLGLLSWLLPMEKMKREALISVLEQLRTFVCDALACRSTGVYTSPEIRKLLQFRTGSELLSVIKSVNDAIDHLNANVSVGAVIGWLSLRLK